MGLGCRLGLIWADGVCIHPHLCLAGRAPDLCMPLQVARIQRYGLKER